jgi:hypothetical protein
MPNWKKLIVSGSDASLNSLNVTNNVTAQSFTGSFSGSFTAPGATTQVVYNNGGVLSADSGFVYSGSNVGIGTSSPTFKFNLEDTGATYVAQFKGGNSTYIISGDTSLPGESGLNARNSSGQLFLGIGPSGDAYFSGTSGATSLGFYLGGTNRIAVNSAGNVGIGTTSPTQKLDVMGRVYVSQSLSVGTTSTAGTGLTVFGSTVLLSFAEIQQGNALYFFSSGNTAYSTITQVSNDLILTPQSNVGIGTSSPSATLEVNGNVKATSFTGSFSGSITHAVSASYALSSSYALTSTTASYALTASYVNPLNQDLILTGSFIATGGVKASNALINGNLTVIGTASFTYTTASYVNVGASTITLNTDNPAVRFGGINVVDSGSFGTSSTGSLLWDSEKNRWIYSNPSGSTYDGGLLISGPRNTTGLGNEQGTTLNALMKGQGGDHITSSGMFEDSSGNVGVGTASPSAKFEVVGNVKATSFTGSFSGSVTAPGSTTQIVYNDNGVLAASSGLVYSGSNVGIGISSPTEKLHIVSSATGNQFGRITATDSNSSAAWVAQNDQGDNVVYRVFGSGVSGTQMGAALGRSASLLANLGGSGVFLLGTFSNTNFILGTNNTENMRITTAGNVGIGTTSPGEVLEVVGNIRANVSNGGGFMLTGASASGLVRAGATGLALRTNTTDRLTVDNSGNVGIGTTSPQYKLDVNGEIRIPNSNYIYINNTAGTAIQAIGMDSGDNLVINTATGGDLYLKSGGSTVFRAINNGDINIGGLSATASPLVKILNNGNVGIGTTSPGYKLEVVGAVSASTYYGDGSNLTNIGSGSISAAGSDGQLQYNNSGLFGGASRLYYNDSTNRVGIGTSSPGYDLDVSGSARVQDRLRVGVVNTGNGVIHQSSDATINPSSSTIVWSVPGSAGICAFIEYYVFNSNTGASQRAGNIVTTWNSAGTPQITHTETTTPDIGTTALVTFTTSITLGGDPQLIATNTSGDVWYMIMNYRYF